MSILRDSTITFFARVLMFLVQGVAALLLARSLGPEGRGLYALIVIVPHIAAMICNFGFSATTAYFVSSGRLSRERVLGISLAIPLFTGIAALFLLYWAAPLYVHYYPEVPIHIFRWGLLLIPFIAIFNNLLGYFQGQKRFVAFNLINLFNPVIFLLIFGGFVLLLNATIPRAIYAWQAGFVVPVLFGLFFAFSNTRPSFAVARRDIAKFTRYSSRIAFNEIFSFLNYRLDIFMIGYFLDARAVGLYTIAVVIAETLWFLASSTASVLLPNFAERGQREAVTLFHRAFAGVLWLTLGLVLLLMLVDDFVVRFAFGSAFLPSLAPLQFLYPGVLLFSLYKIISSFLAARGFPHIIMRFALFGVVVNLGLNLLLIPRWGIAGAAIASSFSYGGMFFLALLTFLRQYSASLRPLFWVNSADLRRVLAFSLGRVGK